MPDKFLSHFNLIHADPKDTSEDIIPEISLDDVVNNIEKVRKYIGVKKISVLGHSMFSPIPLLYASKYPDNTAYAISSGGAPSFAAKYISPGQNNWDSKQRKRLISHQGRVNWGVIKQLLRVVRRNLSISELNSNYNFSQRIETY